MWWYPVNVKKKKMQDRKLKHFMVLSTVGLLRGFSYLCVCVCVCVCACVRVCTRAHKLILKAHNLNQYLFMGQL